MSQMINITHDGILKIKLPKGYKVNQIEVEESSVNSSVIKFVPYRKEMKLITCGNCRHNGSYDTDCPISWPKDEDDFCSYSEG